MEQRGENRFGAGGPRDPQPLSDMGERCQASVLSQIDESKHVMDGKWRQIAEIL
jgi:hypothetical protein